MGNSLVYALIGVLVIFLLILILSKVAEKRMNVPVVGSFTIGALLIIGGAYLYPASSWRMISLGMLLIGIVAIAASVVLLCKKDVSK